MRRREAPAWIVSTIPSRGDVEPVDLSSRITALSMEDHERKTDKVTLTVDNFDLSAFDDPTWRHGQKLKVQFGYPELMSPARVFVIRKITGGRELSVVAHNEGVIMDTVKRRRTFENVTRAEVVRQVAREAGYTGTQAMVDDTEQRFEIIQQSNLTDAQFLRKLAHLEGYEFFIDFDGVHWHRRKVDQSPIRELVYYSDPNAGDIIDFSIENDITRKPGRVRVKARDPIEKEEIDQVASNEEDSNRVTMQPYVGVFTGSSRTLTVTAKPVKATRPPPDNVAEDDVRHSNVETVQEAKVEAKRRFRKTQQVAVKMKMEVWGDPTFVAKSVVQISGMGKRLSGKYYVKAVAHALDAGGYVMSLDLVTDGFRAGYGKVAGSATSAQCQDATNDDNWKRSVLFAGDALVNVLRGADNFALQAAASPIAAALSPIRQGSRKQADLSALQEHATTVARAAKTLKNAQVANLAAKLARAAAAAVDPCVDEHSAGKANDKDKADPRKLKPVGEFTGETRTLTVSFQDSKGRGT